MMRLRDPYAEQRFNKDSGKQIQIDRQNAEQRETGNKIPTSQEEQAALQTKSNQGKIGRNKAGAKQFQLWKDVTVSYNVVLLIV